MYSLTDKVVLITGGANGIGAAIAEEVLKAEAAHVRILDVDERAGKSLQNELNDKYGTNKAKFVKIDVTNDDELFGALEDTKAEHNFVDVVFNNAGVINEGSYAAIRKEVEINLIAVINGTHKAIEIMDKSKGGRGGTVINMASVAGLHPLCPSLPVYSATKSAVLQFTRCIGVEHLHTHTGVRVLALCLGITDTGILDAIATFENNRDAQVKAGFDALKEEWQSAASVGQGALEAYRKGKPASVWLINKSKPAFDIFEDGDSWGVKVAKFLEM